MSETTHFIAVDLGASNGRMFVGQWDGARFRLDELHRFPNGPVTVRGHIYWDVLHLWSQVQAGLARYASRPDAALVSVGVDAWGCDFGLLDAAGHLLGNPHHYRDPRTEGVMERVRERVPAARLFEMTGGVQVSPANTLYQLLSMVETKDPQLKTARTLLWMPDLFHYWLSGRGVAEHTIASTSQMFDCRRTDWATGLMNELGLPTDILAPLVPAGAVLGELMREVRDLTGLGSGIQVVAPGSHDTAVAVAAVPEMDEAGAFISSGTWSLVGIEGRAPMINERVRALNAGNECGVAGTVQVLKNVTGMWLLQQCRGHWRREGEDFEWDELQHLAEAAPPFRSLIDPDHPDFWNPDDMPAAIRAFCRRTGQPAPETVGETVRCCLESLALKYRYLIDGLETATGRKLTTVRIVGGGSRNQLLCRMTAEVCGRTVAAGPVEATALGNVMMQAVTAGHLRDLAEGRRAIALSVERQYYEPRSDWDHGAEVERFSALLDVTTSTLERN